MLTFSSIVWLINQSIFSFLKDDYQYGNITVIFLSNSVLYLLYNQSKMLKFIAEFDLSISTTTFILKIQISLHLFETLYILSVRACILILFMLTASKLLYVLSIISI